MTNFSASECIKFGWETFKKRPGYLIGVTVLYCLISGISSSLVNHTQGGVHMVLSILSWGVSLLLGICGIAFLLRAHEDVEHVSLKDAWKPEVFLNYLGAYILYVLAVVGGLILLIVPGVIFALMLSQTFNLVVDRGMGPIEAMKESARITKGKKGELFLLMLMMIGIVILGVICVLVGLLVAMPVVMLAGIHAYRELSGKADAIIPTTPTTPANPPVIS